MKQQIIAAVSVVLAAAGWAGAQHQVDHSGANDANNRIGSGGRNIVREQPKPWQLSNDLVYGNVTGGKEFRGQASGDPRAFRGSISTVTSDFVRDSSGVSTGGQTSFNAQKTQQFYGDSRAVAPPNGVTMIPGTNSYTPPTPSAWTTIDPRQRSLSSDANLSYRPDLFGMPGAIDTSFAPDAIIVPSIVQARQLNPEQLSDYTQLNRANQNRLSADQLQQLQQELRTNQKSQPDSKIPGSIDDRMGSKAVSDQLESVSPSDAVGTGAIDPNASPEMGVRNTLVGAEKQSKVYSTLMERRKADAEVARPGDANKQAARDFNEAVRKRNEDEKNPGKTDQPTPGVGEQGKPPVDDKTPNVGATKPPKFDTLVDTSKSGLNEMLKRAETQLREGKFNSAIDTYEQAEKVSPNNPLIKLGRTHAELGGGYYRRAEMSLRQTLSADKNLLAGQYDLRSIIGDERLKVVEQDLKDLVQKNTNDTGAAVLLSYVYYNTANERRAAALLDLAEKRSDGKDPFVSVLKKNWSLPAPDGADLNK